MLNIIGLAMLIVIAALLIWSGFRAWRVRSSFLKWGGAGLAAGLAVAVSYASVLTIAGMVKQHARRALVPPQGRGDPRAIGRGKALVDGCCSACHSKTSTLTGGLDIGEDFPLPIESFVSSNLTPAGRLKHWSDGEIFRAIRNGVGPDGRWVTLMSHTNAGSLSDDDCQAVIAYIRSVPAAGEPTADPPDQLNQLGVAMLGAGMLPSGKPVITSRIGAPPKGPTFQIRRIHPVVSGLPRMPRPSEQSANWVECRLRVLGV